jgi:hypothetical protein
LAVFAVAVSLIAGGTMFYRRQMAVTSVAVSADTAAPAPPVPTDTNFDLDSASQPVHEHRQAVGVDTQLLGGRVPNMAAEMPAYIRIVARGGAGRVRLDGTLYGFTPLVMKVDAGTHFVSLESSGDAFQPSQLTIDAVSDDTVQAIFTATAAK